MKVLGVLCLAAYVGCALANGYLSGQEYVYKYEGELFTELNEQPHQHSGFAFKSEVHVQPKKDYYVVKIVRFVYDKLNERVTKERGYDFHYHEKQFVSEILQTPFMVYLQHGLVHHIKVATDDPIWSVNLKKSLADLFQMNFDQLNAVRVKEENKFSEPDLNAHYFKVMEDSLYGECETLYQVSHEPSQFVPYTIPVLNVTKSTNYDHCTKIAYYQYESVNYAQCVDCKSDLTIPDRLSNVLHYNLRGDRHNFVIEKVHAENEFTHMPFTRNGGMAYVHTNRTLLLVEEHDAKEEIQVEGETVSHFDLHFHFYGEHEFDDKVVLKRPHFLYHILGGYASTGFLLDEFNDLLAPLVDGTYPEKFIEHHAPHKFADLVKHFSTLGYDDIDLFYKSYVNIRSDDSVAILARTQMFFDILTSSGTNPAFLFAKNHVFDPNVLPSVAVNFIQMLPFTIKEASGSLFDEIYNLCESEKVHAKPQLQNMCYLAFSSLVHEHCVGKNYKQNVKQPHTMGSGCTPEVAQKYYKHVVHHFENDHDDIELITGIKATGNFGLKDGISYLRKYIENDHFPTYFRVAAIWALRRIAESYPEAVLEEVVPVYFNLSETHEVRIAAFGVLMLCHPSRSVLEAIGVSLNKEHNHQVTSFVSSVFHYFAHSDYPCHKGLKRDMEHVLRHVLHLDSLPQFDLKHSRFWMNSGYNQEFGFGEMSSASYVTSNDSYVPSKLYFGSKDYIMDKNIETVSIVIQQEGLHKFFDRLFGPDGLTKKSLFDLFHRRVARETASVEKELKKIHEALHIKTRHEREIHGDISVRLFGRETSFWYFNESLFEDFLHDCFVEAPDFQEVLKKGPALNFNRYNILTFAVLKFPSCIGFPLFLTYQEPTTLYYKNKEFKFEVTPSFFVKDRNNESTVSVAVHAVGHYIQDMVRRGEMGIHIKFDHIKLGVGVIRRSYVNTPIDIDVNVDLKTWKFNVKARKGQHFNWFHMSATPFTFIDNYSKDVDMDPELEYLPYYKPNEMKEVHERYYHDYLGYGFDVKAKYGKLNVFRSASLARKFFAEHSLRDIYYALFFNPHFASYDLNIDVTPAEADPTEEVEFLLDFDYHDLRSNKPFNSVVYDGYHEDIEEHAKALPGRKFFAYVVKGEIIRKGTKERKVVVEGTYTHSCDHKLQKYTAYYDRSPHKGSETEHFKICANGYVRYPDYDLKKLHDLDTLHLDQKIHALAKIGFGNDCKEDKKITVRGVLSRSEEQVELENKREELDHTHFNPYSHYYHKCKEEHERGAYYGINCRRYIALATRMHHYDIDFEFETEMTDGFKNETKKLFSWLDHKLYYYMDKNYIVEEKPKKLEFHLNFAPDVDTVDFEILRRYSTSFYHDVPVEPIYKPLIASPYLTFTNNIRFNNYFKPSFCSVEGEYVTTFDNVTFHLPPIDCWKVLAKDCSEQEYFLVLGKKSANPNYPKAVKVFLGKSKIEILPVTDTSELNVRVNGNKVEVTQNSPYFNQPGGEDHEITFYVTYNGLYYTISSHKYGVYVFYDGKAIVSQISHYYQGKQCGLCGDFNHESDRDFRGPEDCVYHNATDFAAAYAIHEDGCHAPPVNPSACEIPRQRYPCTVLRNRYVYIGTTNRQLCFSTIPLPECSSECIETRKITRNVGYHCLPAKEASNLQRLSKERVLYELRGKFETHFSEESYPEACQPIQF